MPTTEHATTRQFYGESVSSAAWKSEYIYHSTTVHSTISYMQLNIKEKTY
jgi:hypothetical protein